MRLNKHNTVLGLIGIVLISSLANGQDRGGDIFPIGDRTDRGRTSTSGEEITNNTTEVGGQITNITSSADEVFLALANLAFSLNGSVYPVGAADKIIDALTDLG